MFKENYNKDKIIMYKILVKEKEETHFHQEVELIYILEGEMELNIEENIYNLKNDDILVINPNQKHSYQCSENILMGSFIISFEKLSYFIESDSILFLCNSTIDKESSFEEIRRIIKLIISHYIKPKEKEDFYEHSLFYQLLNLLKSNFTMNKDCERFHNKENRYDNRNNEITNYIIRNYNKPISLNDLAQKLNLTNPYVSRYFKNNLGTNFIDYLYNIRLNHALEDLLYTDATIKKVALDNGFPSTVIFNKIFKARYNVAPSVYVKKMKKNKEDMLEEIELKENIILDRLEVFLLKNNLNKNGESLENNQYIIADTNDKKEYKKNWNKVINVGTAFDLLQSDMQEQLLILKNELKYEYVRFWNIFAHNMNLGEYNVEEKYNFDKIDRVLDFLVDNKMKPFIQLRQKQKRLNKTEEDFVIIEDESPSSINANEWKNIIKTFSKHIVNRYSVEETQTWYFEIWRNQDIKLDIDYFTIFNIAYKELKRYIPYCKVGGAEFTGSSGVERFIKDTINWKEFFVQSDFLSFSLFPYDTVAEDGSNYFFIKSMDKDYVANQVKKIKEILKKEKFIHKEIYITEWNGTLSDRNYVNDSCYKGAYMMKNIIDSIGEVDILGYFIGSDLVSQFYDSNALLNGGAGLISKNAIKKPAYYAIEFMNRIGNRIIDKGRNYIITDNNDGEYFIACHNYKYFNNYYYSKKEDEIDLMEQGKIFKDYNNLCLNFKLKNLLNGQYNIKIYSMSSQNGSILDEWIKMDMDNSLGKDEIEYLKRISTPRLTMKRYVVDEQVLNLGITLIPHECNIISIYRD